MSTSHSLREGYLSSLPDRPYCTNFLGSRLHIRDRRKAADYAIIQHNSLLVWRWMIFDLDDKHAYSRAEDRGCPPPTFIALNRDNGHGHAAYMLETPVTAFSASSRIAIKFYEDVERGMTAKLGADRAYSGFLSKNPLSSRWETDWQARLPYRLDTLNDYLDKADKRRTKKADSSAIGRNVSIFDAVRDVAYQQCLKFKEASKSQDEFATMLRSVADSVNCIFPVRLSCPEIKGIVRSVTKWVWDEFTPSRFSAIQKRRIKARWAKVPTITANKPWELLGVCRRTWERRRSEIKSSVQALLP